MHNVIIKLQFQCDTELMISPTGVEGARRKTMGRFCYYFVGKISNILCGQKTFEDNGPPMLPAKWDCFNYSLESAQRKGRELASAQLRKLVPSSDVISSVCILTPSSLSF